MIRIVARFFGTYEASRGDGTPVHFATEKARALFAYLLVERNRLHRREHLANLLWPEQPERSARINLRQALLHIREALGGDADTILHATSQNVRLAASSEIICDAEELWSAAEACQKHRHVSTGRCLPCMRRQRLIADRYSGEFLAGFSIPGSAPFEEWLLLTRERFHRRTVEALTRLSVFHERRGEFAIAIADTRRLTHLEPWREESHRQLMSLLFAEGSRSEALAQFEHCRRALDTELQIEPAQETHTLAERIRNGAPSIASMPPCPLPASSPFVGRVIELAELEETLSDPDCRLLTLTGPGGIGKTRLALQLAQNINGLFSEGIAFIPLAEADSILSALMLIADHLGMTSKPGEAIAERLADFLLGKEILLLLDNLEHLAAECSILSDLISRAPGVHILVTSRERLRLRQEHVYALDGLAVPISLNETLPPEEFDSIRLFCERAKQADHRFILSRLNLTGAIEICQLVEGFPLGIELAAASAGVRPCSEIAASLRKHRDVSTAFQDLPARHHSLSAVFEHSWNLLPEKYRTVLADLSIFSGGFDACDAEAVTGAGPGDLEILTGKSLLRLDIQRGRYLFHELIRSFSRKKLEENPDRAFVKLAAHSAHYAGLSRRIHDQIEGSHARDAKQRLDDNHSNLLSAWSWATANHQPSEWLSGLLLGVSDYYLLHGPLSDGESHLKIAAGYLKNAEKDYQGLLLDLYLLLARFCSAQAKHHDALEYVETTAPLALLPLQQAKMCLTRGVLLQANGKWEGARASLLEALPIARDTQGKALEAELHRVLGEAACGLSEFSASLSHFDMALDLARELGSHRCEMATRIGLGTAEWEMGRLGPAREHLECALALARQLGDRDGEARALSALSNVAAVQGHLYESIQYDTQALDIHSRMGNSDGQGTALNNLGCTFWCLGEYENAGRHFHEAYELYRRSGNRQGQGETLGNLLLTAGQKKQYDLIEKRFGEAWSLAQESGDRNNMANLCLFRGRIEIDRRKFTAAEEYILRSRELRGDGWNPGRNAEVSAELAFIHFQQERAGQALIELEPLFAMMEGSPELEGSDEPFRAYWQAYQVLRGLRDMRAISLLQTAVRILQQRAEAIHNPAFRNSYLSSVPEHRELLTASADTGIEIPANTESSQI